MFINNNKNKDNNNKQYNNIETDDEYKKKTSLSMHKTESETCKFNSIIHKKKRKTQFKSYNISP